MWRTHSLKLLYLLAVALYVAMGPLRGDHLEFEVSGSVTELSFSPSGRSLAIGTDQGQVSIWNLAKAARQLEFDDLVSVLSLSYFADGKLLAAGTTEGNIHVFDMERFELKSSWKAHESGVVMLRPRDDGQLASLSIREGSCIQWTVEPLGGRELLSSGAFYKPILPHRIALCASRGLLAAVGTDRHVLIWSLATGKVLKAVPEATSPWTFSSDGLMFVGNGRQGPGTFNATTGARIGSFAGDPHGVTQAEFDPSGRAVLAGQRDGKVRIWDPATGKVIRSEDLSPASVTCVGYSPDGGLIAAGSSRGTVHLWPNH